eukprot:COSAG01_NODE_6588_length_3591_cov_1.386598_3_plen_82_part_01
MDPPNKKQPQPHQSVSVTGTVTVTVTVTVVEYMYAACRALVQCAVRSAHQQKQQHRTVWALICSSAAGSLPACCCGRGGRVR